MPDIDELDPLKTTEPFLHNTSETDEVNIAIKQLLQLAELDQGLAIEACEFVYACLADAKKRQTMVTED